MVTDCTLLKTMMNKEVYDKYIQFINFNILDWEIKTLLEDFGDYFKQFECEQITLDEFITWFHHYKHPDLPDSKHKVFKVIFASLPETESEVIGVVLQKFQELETSQRIRELLDKEYNGDELREYLDKHDESIGRIVAEDDEDFIDNDLDLILSTTDKGDGLQWRLNCLRQAVGPLNKGKFVIVGAYVDVGKTMFAISETSYMAQQLKTGCVLWLNNEEENLRVYRKIWKSVLHCSDQKLQDYKDKAQTAYEKRMHGDLNRIKFIDIRSKNLKGIKKLFEQYKPKLAIIDQVDKITNVKHKAFSDHDRLKNLYGEIRSLANKYCPIIAISQADATTAYVDKETQDIKYQLYPHHRQLDGSKVGKPGEADAIIMIGRRNGYNNTRGIHVSKNKFGDTLKQEVIFDGERVRYENPSD